MPTETTVPITALREVTPAQRTLTAEEQAYLAQPPLTDAQQAVYIQSLRGMTEDELNAERQRVQRIYGLRRYGADRATNHPDLWREEQIAAERRRRQDRADDIQSTVAGGILGTLAGATAGAIMGNYKKGAAIGAAAGAVAPHVSDRARNLTRLARMAWAFLGSRGGSFRY